MQFLIKAAGDPQVGRLSEPRQIAQRCELAPFLSIARITPHKRASILRPILPEWQILDLTFSLIGIAAFR
jgi:hypothetical protein